jgi:hypothetical protein
MNITLECNKEVNMKKLLIAVIAIIVFSLFLGCDDPHTGELPITDVNKFIHGNNITFTIWTSANEMYDVLSYISSENNNLNVNNGKTIGINNGYGANDELIIFNSIVFNQYNNNNKNYRNINFYNNTVLVLSFKAEWWNHEPNKLTGSAECAGKDITFSY